MTTDTSSLTRRPSAFQRRLLSASHRVFRPASEIESIALLALTMSLVAMSIDSMLPAISTIAVDLGNRDANERQFIVTSFFAGLTLGRLVWGPISDGIGRKRVLYAGVALYLGACLVCATAQDYSVLLLGRALQGFGASAAQVVVMALVRDGHSGRAMARVMSFVSSLFILVPVFAPVIGQTVLFVASWRAIFWALLAAAALDLAWFALRQPETLPPERRLPLSWRTFLTGAAQTLKNRVALGYMLAAGCIYGCLLSYLTTSQQILQDQYQMGAWFPLIFATIALMLGVSSFFNAKVVTRLGVRHVSRRALLTECALSWLFLPLAWALDGHPPLSLFVGFLAVCFLCQGMLYGNFIARAMEPLGEIAGIAAAVIGSASSLVSLFFAAVCGHAYDGTVLPLVAGFATMTLIALGLTEWAERTRT